MSDCTITLGIHSPPTKACRLEFTQQSGNLTGETFTFHQLGTISWKTGQRAKSALLIALGFLPAQAIGISEAQTLKQNPAAMVGQFGYTPDQVDGRSGPGLRAGSRLGVGAGCVLQRVAAIS